MKPRIPWRPHFDSEPVFNPFGRATERRLDTDRNVHLDNVDEETDDRMPAREADAGARNPLSGDRTEKSK